jgi:hypothetical protein
MNVEWVEKDRKRERENVAFNGAYVALTIN